MCIRDSLAVLLPLGRKQVGRPAGDWVLLGLRPSDLDDLGVCLLYTSDAADERSSVDLGGRRIIKKKKKITPHCLTPTHYRSHKYLYDNTS